MLRRNFCDATEDCSGGLDEKTIGFGFKCRPGLSHTQTTACILPQYMVEDGIADCGNEADICYRNGKWRYACPRKILTTSNQSNLSLYSSYYAEACNQLAGSISASLRPGNTTPFKKMSQLWQIVGNTVSNLTGPRLEPQTSRSIDKRLTSRPTSRYF